MLIIGSHTSFNSEEQLVSCVNQSIEYGSNAFMFYTGSNQSTLRSKINNEKTKEAFELMEKNNIDYKNVVVHAPFIINLANNSDERKYNFYIGFLRSEIQRCIDLGIRKLVLHPGSRVSIERRTALDNIINGINHAIKDFDDFDLILEYMSGKGTEVGSNIDDFVYILSNIEKKNMVSVCIDTCHLNDSGVDLNNFDEFLSEFDLKIGIDKIHVIHVNDSNNIIGSHKDRHANIGYGTIGFNTLLNIVYNDRLKNVPKILETPFYNDKPPYKYEIDNFKNKEFKDFINL